LANEFLEDLYGDQTGIVYSPIKGERWEQHFFEWPQERDKLERHIDDFAKRDVYLSPVLFNEPRIAPETFKGTRHLWTEFDGRVPAEFIEPTMRVLSSQEGHEHWYWKLDNFVTDRKLLEDLTRRIAYHYGADLSVWDYQNVLRPVDTWNHKRNKPVTLINKTDRTYSTNDFLWIPVAPSSTKVSISLGQLPTREEVLAKYKWKLDTLDLLFKEVEVGSRSTALQRIAFDAIEAGCSNEEAYVLIEERDSVWGKFKGRGDRDRQITKCIEYARSKKVLVAETDPDKATEVYRFHDFMHTKIKFKWAIEGLLPVAGSMVILGREGIGKSTFCLRLCMELALGKDFFLNWKITTRQRTLFVSLEMQHGEIKQFFDDMNIPEEVQQELQEWFYIWPIGHAYPFDTPDQQIELLKFIDMHKIELVTIDSLGLSMYGAVTNDDDVKRLNSFMNEDIRKERKCSYIFIHHLRKKGIDEKDSKSLDSSFGSRYITANAQTVLLMTQKTGSTKLEIELIKTRMVIGSKVFTIERTTNRGFQLVGANPSAITVVTGDSLSNGEEGGVKKPKNGSLGELFTF
jgi:hypothetical protein